MDTYEKSYKKYLKDRREKHGPEFGDDYRGSAFDKHIDIKEEVDGDFLRNSMPNKHTPIRADHLSEIEANCIKFMVQKAKDKQFYCKYTVPDIIPGIPLYDPGEVMKKLYYRLKKRKGIAVYSDDKRANTLFISWIPESNEPETNTKKKSSSKKSEKKSKHKSKKPESTSKKNKAENEEGSKSKKPV
jgi:hypothetical protein